MTEATTQDASAPEAAFGIELALLLVLAVLLLLQPQPNNASAVSVNATRHATRALWGIKPGIDFTIRIRDAYFFFEHRPIPGADALPRTSRPRHEQIECSRTPGSGKAARGRQLMIFS